MIVDFNKDPLSSIIYTSSIIIAYLKDIKNSRCINNIYSFCINGGMSYNEIFLSIDWMYLIGIIEKVSDIGEVIISEKLIGILDGIEHEKISNRLIKDLKIDSINEENIRLNSRYIYKFIKQEIINLSNINNFIKRDTEKEREYIEFMAVYSFYKLGCLFNKGEVI